MASSYTDNIALEKQATGENNNTWGTLLNAVLDLVDKAVTEQLSKSVAGSSDVTLTAAEAVNAYHKYTGTLTGNINVIVPALNKVYIVENATSGAYTLTVKTSAGTGIAVTQGKKAILYGDATNVVDVSGSFGSYLATSGGTLTGALIFSDAALRLDKGADIASASPLVLGTDGSYFDVTGTTGFAAITVAAGTFFVLQFDGALTITHGSGITLPGGANITTATGDQAICYATATDTVFVLAYVSAAGMAQLAANTFSGTQNLADNLLQRPKLRDYGEATNSASSSSGTLTLDCESGNDFTTTLTENVTTLTISNWPASGTLGSLTLQITQHASSAKTVSFTGVDFGDAGAPDLTTVGSVTEVEIWTRDGGTTKYGAVGYQKTS